MCPLCQHSLVKHTPYCDERGYEAGWCWCVFAFDYASETDATVNSILDEEDELPRAALNFSGIAKSSHEAWHK